MCVCVYRAHAQYCPNSHPSPLQLHPVSSHRRRLLTVVNALRPVVVVLSSRSPLCPRLGAAASCRLTRSFCQPTVSIEPSFRFVCCRLLRTTPADLNQIAQRNYVAHLSSRNLAWASRESRHRCAMPQSANTYTPAPTDHMALCRIQLTLLSNSPSKTTPTLAR